MRAGLARVGVVDKTELPGVSGPLWTIVLLVSLLAALAMAIYYLYNNRKR